MNTKDRENMSEWRQTKQRLRPVEYSSSTDGTYDLYPAYPVGPGKIDVGYGALAHKLADSTEVVIDGFIGVFWDHFREKLNKALDELGVQTDWIDVSEAMLEPDEIDQLVTPYLGGDDPVFGTRYEGELADFFDQKKLKGLSASKSQQSDITILYGCGSFLAGWNTASLVYVDLPKNELNYRTRAQSVNNLGAAAPEDPKKMYKRFYFVDWIALNKHKESLLPHLDWIVDEQHPSDPAVMEGDTFRNTLQQMSRTYFRARPWFEPGTWGGQWCKKYIPQLPGNTVNYAWSFELITPENGLMFSSDNKLLETSFDWLMYQEYEAVLGDCADTFGYEFPIRFDFLDTFDGGNLSVQCHPRPSFIRNEFGETFTQDETYYIMDCEPDARVYLGFQGDIDPSEFRQQLEQSAENNTRVEIGDFVQTHPSQKHGLYLIPRGTIHCSGIDNMVLEISATPYIFTFKMYDWLRVDMDGNPRPLNIERAFKNLNFDRKGSRVKERLISKPVTLDEGEGWKLVHLPTHEKHFYDIHRFEFSDQVEAHTEGSCHVMSLVEGSSVKLETENGGAATFNYAETFVVPAAAESYRLVNEGDRPAKVVKAFVKDEYDTFLWEGK